MLIYIHIGFCLPSSWSSRQPNCSSPKLRRKCHTTSWLNKPFQPAAATQPGSD